MIQFDHVFLDQYFCRLGYLRMNPWSSDVSQANECPQFQNFEYQSAYQSEQYLKFLNKRFYPQYLVKNTVKQQIQLLTSYFYKLDSKYQKNLTYLLGFIIHKTSLDQMSNVNKSIVRAMDLPYFQEAQKHPEMEKNDEKLSLKIIWILIAEDQQYKQEIQVNLWFNCMELTKLRRQSMEKMPNIPNQISDHANETSNQPYIFFPSYIIMIV